MTQYRKLVSTALVAVMLLSAVLWGGLEVLRSQNSKNQNIIAAIGKYELPLSLMKQLVLNYIIRFDDFNLSSSEKLANTIKIQVVDVVNSMSIAEYFIQSGLIPPDAYIMKQIKQFYTDKDGTYNKQDFIDELKRNNRTFESLKQEKARIEVWSMFIHNIRSMQYLPYSKLRTKILHSYNEEERNIQHLQIDPSNFTPTIQPNEHQLLETYNSNKDKFTKKRIASIKYINIDFDSIFKNIRVSNQEIEELKKTKIKSQNDNTKAKLEFKSDNGKFLGAEFTRERAIIIFGPTITKKIFAKNQTKAIGPFEYKGIKYSFRSIKLIKPDVTLDKATLKELITMRKKDAALRKIDTTIDSLKSKNPDIAIEDISKAIKQPVLSTDINEDSDSSLASQVFSLEQNVVSNLLMDDSGDGVFIIQVTKVTPANLIPLEKAKKSVESLWLALEAKESAKKLAASIVAEVNQGKISLQKAAEKNNLTLNKTGFIKRYSIDTDLSKDALLQAFSKTDAGFSLNTNGSWSIFKAEDIRRLSDNMEIYESKAKVRTIKNTVEFSTFRAAIYAYHPFILKQVNSKIYNKSLMALTQDIKATLEAITQTQLH